MHLWTCTLVHSTRCIENVTWWLICVHLSPVLMSNVNVVNGDCGEMFGNWQKSCFASFFFFLSTDVLFTCFNMSWFLTINCVCVLRRGFLAALLILPRTMRCRQKKLIHSTNTLHTCICNHFHNEGNMEGTLHEPARWDEYNTQTAQKWFCVHLHFSIFLLATNIESIFCEGSDSTTKVSQARSDTAIYCQRAGLKLLQTDTTAPVDLLYA